MLSPRLVGRLRRSGVWGVISRVHAGLAPRACQLVHLGLTGLPPALTPTELSLKHRYDYDPVWVPPESIQYSVPVGNWRKGRSAAGGRLSAPMRWYTHGGGWKSARRHLTRNLHGRFVLDGDWDANLRPFEVRPIVAEVFEQRRRPRDTAEYQKLRSRVEAGDLRWTHGCTTVEEVDRYFDAMLEAFDSIRREGYRTQAELGVPGGDEIRVCVDRHGRPCVFGGGTHRLSIAKYLALEGVPVLVKRVHKRWVLACQDRYGGSPQEAIAAGLRDLGSQLVPEGRNSVPHRRREGAGC